MENNNFGEFEKFIQNELNGLDESAQEQTWAQIAARQKKPNLWLKTKYYGAFALPALTVLLVAALAVHQYGAQNGALTQGNNQGVSAPDLGVSTAQNMEHIAPNDAPILSSPVSHGQKPFVRIAPGNTKINKFPTWYKQNDVPVAAVRFEAEQGIAYQNPVSGNTVNINANSLVYANGQPVKGAVDLFFREYRDIPDMLSADIPMHYTDERGAFFFNTGGMFDVRVAQNGQELFMAPGQAYDVQFAATNNLSNASLFYLNEQTNNWAYISDQPFSAEIGGNAVKVANFDVRNMPNNGAQPPLSTEATVARENTNSDEAKCLPESPNFFPEQDAVQWVKETVELGVALSTGKQSLPIWYKKNPTGNDDYFTFAFDRSEIKLIYANDQEMRFFPQDLNGMYKEFEAFKDCYFIRTSDSLSTVSSPNAVNAIFNNANSWRSFTVTPDGNSANCMITLGTEREGFIRIHAQLVRTSESGTAAAFDATQVFAKYWQLREQRLNGLLGELRTLRRFTETSQMFQEEAEFCLTEKMWLQYFEKNLPLMRARYTKLQQDGMSSNDNMIRNAVNTWVTNVRALKMDLADKVAGGASVGKQLSTVLSLTGFGAYNCDQIFQMTKMPTYTYVNFKTTTGAKINASAIRILDKATKMFLSFPTADKIVNLPGRKLEVVVTDAQGRLYLMHGDDYSNAISKNAERYSLTVKDVTDTVQSPSGWADLLGI